MLLDVRVKFDNALRDKFITEPDKLKYVMTHERKNFVLNNLCHQIVLAEKTIKQKLMGKMYDHLISSVANSFADLCILHRKESFMTENEKAQIAKDRAIHDDIEAEQEDLQKFLNTTQKDKVTLWKRKQAIKLRKHLLKKALKNQRLIIRKNK